MSTAQPEAHWHGAGDAQSGRPFSTDFYYTHIYDLDEYLSSSLPQDLSVQKTAFGRHVLDSAPTSAASPDNLRPALLEHQPNETALAISPQEINLQYPPAAHASSSRTTLDRDIDASSVQSSPNIARDTASGSGATNASRLAGQNTIYIVSTNLTYPIDLRFTDGACVITDASRRHRFCSGSQYLWRLTAIAPSGCRGSTLVMSDFPATVCGWGANLLDLARIQRSRG